MPDKFISEQLTPDVSTINTRTMVSGEPGLPQKFIWRGKEIVVEAVLEKWKETGRCTSGADEQYVRKHWFRILTTDGSIMKIYFERQPASKQQRMKRWWLFSMSKPD
jgi:hypothetical protein